MAPESKAVIRYEHLSAAIIFKGFLAANQNNSPYSPHSSASFDLMPLLFVDCASFKILASIAVVALVRIDRRVGSPIRGDIGTYEHCLPTFRVKYNYYLGIGRCFAKIRQIGRETAEGRAHIRNALNLRCA